MLKCGGILKFLEDRKFGEGPIFFNYFINLPNINTITPTMDKNLQKTILILLKYHYATVADKYQLRFQLILENDFKQ